jgi:hypothetical protein
MDAITSSLATSGGLTAIVGVAATGTLALLIRTIALRCLGRAQSTTAATPIRERAATGSPPPAHLTAATDPRAEGTVYPGAEGTVYPSARGDGYPPPPPPFPTAQRCPMGVETMMRKQAPDTSGDAKMAAVLQRVYDHVATAKRCPPPSQFFTDERYAWDLQSQETGRPTGGETLFVREVAERYKIIDHLEALLRAQRAASTEPTPADLHAIAEATDELQRIAQQDRDEAFARDLAAELAPPERRVTPVVTGSTDRLLPPADFVHRR